MKKMILSKGDHIQTWFNDFKGFRVEKVKRQKRKARKLLLAKRTAEAVVTPQCAGEIINLHESARRLVGEDKLRNAIALRKREGVIAFVDK